MSDEERQYLAAFIDRVAFRIEVATGSKMDTTHPTTFTIMLEEVGSELFRLQEQIKGKTP